MKVDIYKVYNAYDLIYIYIYIQGAVGGAPRHDMGVSAIAGIYYFWISWTLVISPSFSI